MIHKRSDEDGIILIVLLFIVVLVAFGYVVFNSITKSKEAEQVRDAASDTVEAAEEAVNQINEFTR